MTAPPIPAPTRQLDGPVGAAGAAAVSSDIRRLASALFCSPDLDPTVITFVKGRIRDHRGVSERELDAALAARLLGTATSLLNDRRLTLG